MMGHKTNGDWSDVTSIGRNDIVFEGRNKSYGAYYVRKRYNSILLLSLLISLSAGVIAGAIPLIANYFRPKPPVVNNIPLSPKDSVRLIDYKFDTPKPPKPTPPAPKPPVTNQTQDVIPDIKHTVDNPDTNTVAKQNDGKVGTTTVTDKPDTGIKKAVVTDPGPKTDPGPAKFVDWAPIMPKFHGDINDYLSKHIEYPELMRETNVEGIVYASFIVEPDGSVSSVTVLRGVPGGGLLDKEAVRVLAGMPKWDPGSQNGQAVRVRYRIPIHFQLSASR